jgi:DNA invertase Pin-like site-specific DNA recombinase
MEAVYYVRISSLSQNNFNPSSSIETQTHNIKKFIKDNNFKLHRMGNFNEVGSAKNDDKRPVFKRMIRKIMYDVGFYNTKFIIVNDVSRFHRNIHLGLNILEKLSKKGITVISINDKCKYGPPPVKLFEKIKFRNKLIEAENEWLKISERSRSTVEFRKERGDYFGRPPFGYSTKRENNGKIKLIENVKEQKILEKINKMINIGITYRQISFHLNKKKELNRGKEWTESSISYYANKEKMVFPKTNTLIQFLPKVRISKKFKKSKKNSQICNQNKKQKTNHDYNLRNVQNVNYDDKEINIDESLILNKKRKRYFDSSEIYSMNNSESDYESDSNYESSDESSNESDYESYSNLKKKKKKIIINILNNK